MNSDSKNLNRTGKPEPFSVAGDASSVFFQTAQKRYMYRGRTGQIFECKSSLVRCGSAEESGYLTNKRESPNELCSCPSLRAVKAGLSYAAVADAIAHNLRHISFGVTQDCNMRCRYCVYSGDFSNYRKHMLHYMSEETANKAINYFVEHVVPGNKTVFVGFYGGEPFLNFSLIKFIHARIKKELGDRVLFTITTNGTLLQDEQIDFLVANRIYVNISLDGNKEIHNSNRIFRNGGPTFNRIMGNVSRLIAKDEDYSQTYVHFICVATAGVDYKQLDQFFSGFRNMIQVIPAMTYGNGRLSSPGVNNRNFDYLREKFIEGCISHAFEDPVKKWEYEFALRVFGHGIEMIHNRRVSDTPLFGDVYYLRKHCIPGATKLFVATDGLLYPCERLDSYQHLSLGHIDQGVSSEKSYECLTKYAKLRTKYCVNCFLIDICDYCLQSASNPKDWDEAKMQMYCHTTRLEFIAAFQLYSQILEKDESALDFLLEN